MTTTLTGQSLVAGSASAPLLLSTVPLSFWGGVDPHSGSVIDQHHPLHGQNVAGCILAIPGGRGSSTGSSVLLELILNNCAPAGLVFYELEEILTLGVVVADVMFDKSLPIVLLNKDDFSQLSTGDFVKLNNQSVSLYSSAKGLNDAAIVDAALLPGTEPPSDSNIPTALEPADRALLNGELGKAAQVAMKIMIRMATIQGAESLTDVTQAHIDGCVYNGKSSLEFARKLVDWGAQVRVPTTLNAISVDQRRWRQHGIDPAFGEPASALGDAYLQMGAQRSFTCAPYLLDSAPKQGEQIVWAESNAVVFANSVIGARTQKYADFLDICIALTGRAPFCGGHSDRGRQPNMSITVQTPLQNNDAYWPLLGYHLGLIARNELPMIYGLENTSPSQDELKAFSAAFATTSSTPMFHMAGVTPESEAAHHYLKTASSEGIERHHVSADDLRTSFDQLNTASLSQVDVVCLGNPHFSLSECASLAALCQSKCKSDTVKIYVTLGRAIHEAALIAGHIKTLESFGVEFITDTCWCMLVEPVIPAQAQVLMTNSGKYAHYAPGLVNKDIYFDSLSSCVEAAITGKHLIKSPDWL